VLVVKLKKMAHKFRKSKLNRLKNRRQNSKSKMCSLNQKWRTMYKLNLRARKRVSLEDSSLIKLIMMEINLNRRIKRIKIK
jgi:hypothetical protein